MMLVMSNNEGNERNIMYQGNENRLLTVPNLLSFFRLCLIPVFVWLYIAKQDYLWACIVLVLSGLTDLADGFVARRFNSISNLGKILDPIADKLTQGVVLICLVARFPFILAALVLFILKEILSGIVTLVVMRRTGQVHGAEWHGKLSTLLIYALMIIHVLWHGISAEFSNSLIILCIAVMALSFVLYALRNIRLLAGSKANENQIPETNDSNG